MHHGYGNHTFSRAISGRTNFVSDAERTDERSQKPGDTIMKTLIAAALLSLSLTAAHAAPATGDFAVDFYKQLSERGN